MRENVINVQELITNFVIKINKFHTLFSISWWLLTLTNIPLSFTTTLQVGLCGIDNNGILCCISKLGLVSLFKLVGIIVTMISLKLIRSVPGVFSRFSDLSLNTKLTAPYLNYILKSNANLLKPGCFDFVSRCSSSNCKRKMEICEQVPLTSDFFFRQVN